LDSVKEEEELETLWLELDRLEELLDRELLRELDDEDLLELEEDERELEEELDDRLLELDDLELEDILRSTSKVMSAT
jgi:hypothetical protein